MSTANLLPPPRATFFDANGAPLAGGLVHTYVPGGITPSLTWQDATQTSANSNPIVLDADGSCLLYGVGSYQITVTDSVGNSIPTYSGLTSFAPVGWALGLVNAIGNGLSLVGTTLSATQTLPSFANISALRAYTGTVSPVWMQGYNTPGDGGGGAFVYVASDTTSTDNGGTIIIATGSRYYREREGQSVNINWFGGLTTVSDCAAALVSALAVIQIPGGTVEFPAGKYTFLSQVSYTFSPVNSVSITGAGSDATILYWPSTSGLSIHASSAFHNFHMRDLTMATGASGTVVGVHLDNSVQGGAIAQSDFTRVTFRGLDGGAATNYWEKGIDIAGNSLFNYDTCVFYGPVNGDTGVGFGVDIKGAPGGAFKYSLIHNFIGCSFFNLGSCIVYGTWVQGVSVTACNFTNVQTGIYLPAASVGAAQLAVSGSQFAGSGNCILLAGPLPALNVTSSLFFINAGQAGIGSSNTLIQAAITGNTFNGNATVVGNSGIFLGGGGAANVISGNAFFGLGTGVALAPASSNWNVQSNAYSGCTANVVNAGAGNTIGGGSV
jgi:hypothetical protein